MESAMLSAIDMLFNIKTILLILLGVIGGITVGSMPGLSATMAIAILTPFTFTMAPMDAIMVLLGVYVGGVYGGSIAGILLHIPGTPAAIMTARDGYPMAKKGLAGQAIGISTISSFIGGIISIFTLIIAAPFISSFALKFSAPEYFALAIFGLSIIVNISGRSLLKGLIAAAIGILIATIGMDPVTGINRFTFGTLNLQTGISFVPLMIGLFGLSEIIEQLMNINVRGQIKQNINKVVPNLYILKRIFKVVFKSSLIGTFIGSLPGAGASIAAFIAYNNAQQTSKYSKEFGKGAPEGIASSESANNAVVGGALMPLLTLGVPGDAVTAILIGSFMIHNIQPGPMLFSNSSDIVYGIYIGTIIANIFMLFVGLAGSKVFARVINLPQNTLLPIILLFCIIGAYATSNSYFDVGIMILSGVLGFIFIKLDIPIAAMVLGVVLGPIAEQNLRTALIMSENNFSILFTRPIAAFFWLITIGTLLYPYLKNKLQSRKEVLS